MNFEPKSRFIATGGLGLSTVVGCPFFVSFAASKTADRGIGTGCQAAPAASYLTLLCRELARCAGSKRAGASDLRALSIRRPSQLFVQNLRLKQVCNPKSDFDDIERLGQKIFGPDSKRLPSRLDCRVSG